MSEEVTAGGLRDAGSATGRRRWLGLVALGVALGVAQAAVLAYNALYEFGSYPLPYSIALTLVVGALWYWWGRSVRELAVLLGLLTAVCAVVLVFVFTIPNRVVDEPTASVLPNVVRLPVGDPSDMVLRVAVFRSLVLLLFALPLLVASAAVARVLHGETRLRSKLGDRGSLSAGATALTLALLVLGAALLGSVTTNYRSVVEQSSAEMTPEALSVEGGEVTVTVAIPNRLAGAMRVDRLEVFVQLNDSDWYSVTREVSLRVPAGATERVTVAFDPGKLAPERVCDAEGVVVDGIVYTGAFHHYEKNYPIVDTAVGPPAGC